MARESLRATLLSAVRRLEDAGVPSARVDAEELAAHLLGVPRTRLGLTPLVDGDFRQRYEALVQRRAERIPLQHILGEAPLGSITVDVGPGVFIPRPETELLVDWAVSAIAEVPRPVVVDLCTGTAVIALAIAAARPDATVYAVERDPAALAWARRNVDRYAQAGHTKVRLRG